MFSSFRVEKFFLKRIKSENRFGPPTPFHSPTTLFYRSYPSELPSLSHQPFTQREERQKGGFSPPTDPSQTRRSPRLLDELGPDTPRWWLDGQLGDKGAPRPLDRSPRFFFALMQRKNRRKIKKGQAPSPQ